MVKRVALHFAQDELFIETALFEEGVTPEEAFGYFERNDDQCLVVADERGVVNVVSALNEALGAVGHTTIRVDIS